MKITPPDALFCVGQKAIIQKGNEVLILHDPLPKPGNIDLPGGKIQEGETDFINALKREVFEESGLVVRVGQPFYTSYWEFPADSVHRNKGKKIYLVFFTCTYVSGEVQISSEHDWFKWVTKENYAASFKHRNNVYDALTFYFALPSIMRNASLSEG